MMTLELPCDKEQPCHEEKQGCREEAHPACRITHPQRKG
jgi:hypothetical protein